MTGNRQQVRQAIAQYFGGTLVTADAGICYQNGPLVSAHLGTAFPYKVKKSAPDQYYTHGMPAGTGWGAVLTVSLTEQIGRIAIGGATSGWRARRYRTRCSVEVLSTEPHLETAEAGLDDLIDALIGLIYADRTLGTTDPVAYPPPVGRLITQAGEAPEGISVGEPEFVVADDRGRAFGGVEILFETFTAVQA
jgi:hypothetical protein